MFQQRNFNLRISLVEFQTSSFKIFFFIFASFNLLLTFLPLTKTLGYEFSVINSFILFMVGGLHVIINHQKFFLIDVKVFLLKNKFFIISSIVIPFLIGFLSSILNSNCPIKGGVLFYLIISIPSLFIGGALGCFCIAISRKYSLYLFIIISLVLILSPLIEFFYNPQIYFYNPVFGYFPGTIYDEDLRVDHLLIIYRTFNIAFFILVFYSARIIIDNNNRIKKVFIVFVLLMISITFSILKPKLLFASDNNRIEKELASMISTNNFRIHLPDSLQKDKDNRFIVLLHEYYLDQIKIQLNSGFRNKIDSYLFAGKKSKRELIGSGNADIAKPWLNQIYLNYYNQGETLKHEIVHILAGEFGSTPFRVSADFNPAMIEGLAMSIENNYDEYPVHYMAKLAFKAGYKYSIEKLFSGVNFFSQISSISYIYAGSFLKYLEDKFGISKIKYLYEVNDFQRVYGKNLTELAKLHELFLESYNIEFNRNIAQFYFGGVSIFKKYCPRMAASDVNRAWELYQNKNYSEALDLFKNIYNYSNSYQSLLGIVSSYLVEQKYIKAEKFLSNQIVNFRTSQYFFNLELILADLQIQTHQFIKGNSLYDSLIVQNPHIAFANEVLIRKTILQEGIDSLKNYFKYNRKLRLQKLLSLNSKGIKYFSIPALIKLSVKDNSGLDSLITDLKSKIIVNDISSSYAAMEISKYALKNLDFETAQYFAVKSLDFRTDDNRDFMVIENLRMVNWFKNNYDEIKITYSN